MLSGAGRFHGRSCVRSRRDFWTGGLDCSSVRIGCGGGADRDCGEDLFTRAELVSALHQKAGSPAVNFAMQYTDVEQGAEYAEAIRWASSEKIAGGYGEEKFGPEDPVTREQMALILYRYAQNNDQGFTGAWAFPLNYSDASQISEYAYEAVYWVTMKDVMGEKEEQAFVPQGTVTQQEADTMLTQYFTVLEQADVQ